MNAQCLSVLQSLASGANISSTSAMYFFSVTFLFSFRVGVSSPPGIEKSVAISLNLRMCAARDTDFLFVASMHLETRSTTLGSLTAASEVFRSRPSSFLK